MALISRHSRGVTQEQMFRAIQTIEEKSDLYGMKIYVNPYFTLCLPLYSGEGANVFESCHVFGFAIFFLFFRFLW